MALTLLITSGPTREYIDPVRFISNASSGKMGQAIVQSALKKGFDVVMVKGPSDCKIKSKRCKIIDVISTKDMFNAVKENISKADVFIGAAAVSDYRPEKFSKNKIKKTDGTLNIKLVKNPDIISYVSKHRKKGQVVIGFALESKNLLEYAKTKLSKKNLDMIVANGTKTIGADSSNPHFIYKDGTIKEIKMSSKNFIAKEIINEAIKLCTDNKNSKKCS